MDDEHAYACLVAPTVCVWPDVCRGCLCSDHGVVYVDVAGNKICEMSAGTHEALEFAGTSINFRSGKFGYSICPTFRRGHAEFFCEFWHETLLKIGHMGYCD